MTSLPMIKYDKIEKNDKNDPDDSKKNNTPVYNPNSNSNIIGKR